MTDAAFTESPPPPPVRKMRVQLPPDAAPLIVDFAEAEAPKKPGKTAAHPWFSMDEDGDTPPPKDGKWLWLSPDGGSFETAVEAYWKHTRRFDWSANGGRGGWVTAGWWAHRTPPYAGARIEFEPAGWRPKND